MGGLRPPDMKEQKCTFFEHVRNSSTDKGWAHGLDSSHGYNFDALHTNITSENYG